VAGAENSYGRSSTITLPTILSNRVRESRVFAAKPFISTVKRVNILAVASLLLTSCANQHFRVPAEGPPSDAPGYVELLSETQVATLHFPPGPYSFYAVDDMGYYYRAPRKILEHTGGGSVPCNGGIFVSKRDPRKLRGYVYLAGALTHVGNLSRARHELHD
jgi:hypothetical protein